MSPSLLSHAIHHGKVWAILPEFANDALAYLQDANYEAHLKAYQKRMAAPTPKTGAVNPEDRPYRITTSNGKNVALISIEGPMTRKPTSYGGCSTLLTQHAIRVAGRDEGVDAVLIVFSSPGGSVNGLQELTDEIAAVAKIKPVNGFIPDGAYSAAYYAAMGVRRLTIAETAQVGSLGTMMVLTDSTTAAEKQGYKVQVISTGPLKGQGTPGTPPSEEYVGMLTEHAEAYGDFFWKAIQKGRGFADSVRDDVFTGRYWMAKDALALGLVDAIGSLDDAMAELVETTATEEDDEEGDPVGRASAAGGVNFRRDESGGAVPVRFEANSSEGEGVTVVSGFVNLTPELQNAMHAEAWPRLAAPTISAPGGQPGSAGISTAPTSGAENPKPIEGYLTMSNITKTDLCRALKQRGYEAMALAVNNDPSEDGYGVVNALVNALDAEVRNKEAKNPLLNALDIKGIGDTQAFSKLCDRAEIGAEAHADLLDRVYQACVMANGAEEAGRMKAGWADLSYAALGRKLTAYEADSDRTYRNGKDEPAKRQTANTGAVAELVDQPEAEGRLWDQLDAKFGKGTAAKAEKEYNLKTDEQKDAFAARFFGKEAN